MAFFVSTVMNRVDRKGRVSVPAPFRAGLVGGANVIALFQSFKSPCLEGTDLDYLQKLANEVDLGINQFFADADDRVAALMERAQLLAFDPEEGRVVLPKTLLDFAGIGEEAVFVGQGKTFQIWAPGPYERFRAERASRAVELGKRLAAAKGEEA